MFGNLIRSIQLAINKIAARDYRLFTAFLRALFVLMGFLLALIVVLFAISAGRDRLSKIPLFIQIFAFGIIVLVGMLARVMLKERSRLLKSYVRFLGMFENLPQLMADRRASGLSDETMAEIRRRSLALKGPPREWWLRIEESLEMYRSSNGRRGWFVIQPIPEILNEDTLVWAEYHTSYYQAIPGIVTALGLLGTFIAILQGLSGVTYNPQDLVHPVSGIDSLINGLSGKFLTSIVALILSISFTFVEKKICESSILREHGRLLARSKEALPYLSQSRILLDLQTTVSQYIRAGEPYADKMAAPGGN